MKDDGGRKLGLGAVLLFQRLEGVQLRGQIRHSDEAAEARGRRDHRLQGRPFRRRAGSLATEPASPDGGVGPADRLASQ